MVKSALKGTYLVWTTPTAIKNEESTCRKIYHDKDTRVMVNQLVNKFYTRLLFDIDALTQDVDLLLDINATLFNNLITDVIKLFIS